MKPTTSDKILPRWKYFRRLLDRGSFKTVDELEARIYSTETVRNNLDQFLRDADDQHGQN